MIPAYLAVIVDIAIAHFLHFLQVNPSLFQPILLFVISQEAFLGIQIKPTGIPVLVDAAL